MMVSRALASDIASSQGDILRSRRDADQEISELWEESLKEYATLSQLTVEQATRQFSEYNIDEFSTPRSLVDEVVKPWDDFNPPGLAVPPSALRRRARTALQIIFTCFDAIDRLADLAKNIAFPPAQVIAGAIFMLIKASQNQAAENDQAIDVLEQIQFFLSRLELDVEAHLVSQHVRRVFVLILRDILLICARLVKITKSGRMRGYLRNLFVGQDGKLNALQAHLGTLVNEEIRLITMRSAATIEMTNRQINSMSIKIDTLRSGLPPLENKNFHVEDNSTNSMALLRELRQTLETANTQEDLIRFKKSYLPGTGDWLIHHPVYQTWLAKEGLLWIYGAPGIGKSTLSAYAIDKLIDLDNSSVLYFFCRYDDPQKGNPKTLLKTAVIQLAEQDATYRSELLKLKEKGLNLDDMDLLSLWYHAFDQPLRKYDGKAITWVIDGIDELDSSDQIDLVELLATMLVLPHPIKILLVSRQHVACMFVLSRLKPPNIAIHPSDTADAIEKFSQLASSSLPLGDMQEKFAAALKSRSNGLFLWVRLVIDQVRREDNSEAIWRVFDACPDDLGSLYEKIFIRIAKEMPQRRQQLVRKLFDWSIQSQGPLHIQQLDTILSFGGGKILDIEKTISESTYGLMVIDIHGKVGLLHYSVHEYIVSRSTFNASVDHLFDFTGSQKRVALFCLHYLSQPVADGEGEVIKSESFQKILDYFPMLEYTSRWLGFHCTSVDIITDGASELLKEIDYFFEHTGYARMMFAISQGNWDSSFMSFQLSQINQWRSKVLSKGMSILAPSEIWEQSIAKRLASSFLQISYPYSAVWGAFFQAESVAREWGGPQDLDNNETHVIRIAEWAAGPDYASNSLGSHNIADVFWFWHCSEAALRHYTSAADKEPQTRKFSINAALCSEALNRNDEAASYYQRAFNGRTPKEDELLPLRRDFWLRRRAYRAPSLIADSAALQTQIEAYENRVSHDSHSYGAYADLGKLHFQSGNYKSAIDVYQRAIKEFPQKAWIYNMIGNCYKMLQETQDADDWYTKSVELITGQIEADPTSSNSYVLLGHALFGGRKFDQAKWSYEKALRMQNVQFSVDGSATLLHRGIYCDGLPCQKISSEKVIEGVRFSCMECVNFDICFSCWKDRSKVHDPAHHYLMIPGFENKEFKLYLEHHYSEIVSSLA